MPDYVELGIFAALQAGGVIAAIAYLKADVHNLRSWLRRVDQTAEIAAQRAAEMKGHLDNLPCYLCRPKIGE